MSRPAQTYANHARFVPGYHFVLSAVLLANIAFTAIHLYRHRDWSALMGAVMALALVALYLYPRSFAVTVQDRVIRLEESLRYQRLLPADLQARTGELTIKQITALRFAGDAELPALLRRALDERLSDKAIKQAVTSWRPDHLRA